MKTQVIGAVLGVFFFNFALASTTVFRNTAPNDFLDDIVAALEEVNLDALLNATIKFGDDLTALIDEFETELGAIELEPAAALELGVLSLAWAERASAILQPLIYILDNATESRKSEKDLADLPIEEIIEAIETVLGKQLPDALSAAIIKAIDELTVLVQDIEAKLTELAGRYPKLSKTLKLFGEILARAVTLLDPIYVILEPVINVVVAGPATTPPPNPGAGSLTVSTFIVLALTLVTRMTLF